VLVGASGAAAGWIGAAILATGRGFDIIDEGFYLLSYRWWSSIEWNFTGAQYLYGPLFQALHYDIAALHLVRLATIIVTHLLFGWAFMCWLRLRRRRACGRALGSRRFVAAGGMIYGWLPASPGYNDVVQLGALLIMAVVFDLYARLRPRTEQPGRAVIAFDQMSGIVLLLGGRPVGEPWTSPADPRRTASGIKAECARGRPAWWGDRPADPAVQPLRHRYRGGVAGVPTRLRHRLPATGSC